MRWPRRGWLWVIAAGASGGVAMIWLVPRQDLALALLGLLVAVCMVGMILELAGVRLSAKSTHLPPRRRDAAPADGHVELVPIASVRTDPNARDPRFRRFVGLEPSESIAPISASTGTPALWGRVVLLSFFIGKHVTEWSEEEIAQASRALLRAGEWLEKEAMRWHAALNVAISQTYFTCLDPEPDDVEVAFEPEGDHEAPMEAHALSKALAMFSRAAAQVGFRDAEDLIETINRRTPADAWVWLLHPRCAGRSWAVPAAETPWPGVTLAVCYAQEANFPEPLDGPPFADPITFVHELLHLFGANDKYEEPLHRYERAEVTDRDIMCLNHNGLSRMRIDRLTAREIGWLDER